MGNPGVVEPLPPGAAVGVVVINWNGYRDTAECLQSLLDATPRPSRIVVVDNGSIDASLGQIREWAEQRGADGDLLTVLSLPDNRGFAAGNNLGLRHLALDPRLTHFLLLNNDATVSHDFFAQLDLALRVFPHAGLLTGTIYYAGARDTIWYAGGRLRLTRASVRHSLATPAGERPRPTDFVSGCAMLISRAALEAVGYLWDGYFPIYWEDAEFSLRVSQAGLSLVYAPACRVYHKVNGSASNSTVTRTFVFAYHRNRSLFAWRNLTGLRRYAALGYLVLVGAIRGLWFAARGRSRTGLAAVAGTLSGVFRSSRGASPP